MDSSGEKPLPENNWVWSPQGLIAMHYPEMWGLVQFSTTQPEDTKTAFTPPTDLNARTALWQVYYAQREYEARHNRFCSHFDQLYLPDFSLTSYSWPPVMHVSERSFVAELISLDGTHVLCINDEGRLVSLDTPDKDR
jgi:hypothetical protein